MYLLSVPSVSSRYFNKIKQTFYLGKLPALSLEILQFKLEMKHHHGDPSIYTVNQPKFIVSNQMEESIRIQKVKEEMVYIYNYPS